MTRRPWTEQDIATLRRLYANTPTKELAEHFGRSLGGVYDKVHELQLKKSPHYLLIQRRESVRAAGTSTRWAPGTPPWNKGIPGSTGNHSNTQRTQFKAGRAPEEARNYQPIGSQRICKDSYLERKVTDGQSIAPARRWVGVHRLVWFDSTPSVEAAIHREKQMKNWKREWKIALIERDNPQWLDLYDSIL